MSENNAHTESQNAGVKKTVMVLLLIMTVFMGLLVNRIFQPRVLSTKELVNSGAIMFSVPREISAFEFTDQNQQLFSKQQLQGKWTLVFFGFTHCPDICPATLSIFNALSQELMNSEFFSDTQFLFVTLDPARDTPEKIKPYIEYFNKYFVGVTGDFLDIHRFSKELNVAFQKVVTDRETGEYTVDHGGNIALINPAGHYFGFFKPPIEFERLALTYQSVRRQHK